MIKVADEVLVSHFATVQSEATKDDAWFWAAVAASCTTWLAIALAVAWLI
jgi:hypothetical protein